MAKHIYDKPVELYRHSDNDDYDYDSIGILHAHINTAPTGDEKFEGGAMQYDTKLNFYFRYSAFLKAVMLHPQLYRLKWDGDFYDIVSGDDYHMKHKEITLKAVMSNGGRY